MLFLVAPMDSAQFQAEKLIHFFHCLRSAIMTDMAVMLEFG